MHESLTGKTVLVTGAAQRVGREIALALARRGCRIALHYLSSMDAAEATAGEIRAEGVECEIVRADLSRPVEAAVAMFEQLEGADFLPDHLVHNASIFEPGNLFETDESLWDRHFAINLKAPFFLSREFARCITARSASGAIVSIADWRGLRPVPGHDAYTLSKAGLIAMTKLLAGELAPSIRVNAVAPGAVLPVAGDATGQADRAATSIPLRRAGTPADVAGAVVFLLESPFVTGEVLTVDGGEGL